MLTRVGLVKSEQRGQNPSFFFLGLQLAAAAAAAAATPVLKAQIEDPRKKNQKKQRKNNSLSSPTHGFGWRQRARVARVPREVRDACWRMASLWAVHSSHVSCCMPEVERSSYQRSNPASSVPQTSISFRIDFHCNQGQGCCKAHMTFGWAVNDRKCNQSVEGKAAEAEGSDDQRASICRRRWIRHQVAALCWTSARLDPE